MRLKKFIAPVFIEKNKFGEFEIKNAELYYDEEITKITPKKFNQDKDDWFIDGEEAKRIDLEATKMFFNSRVIQVISDSKRLTIKETEGVMHFLRLNMTDLAILLGMSKSALSRILSGESKISRSLSIHLMNLLEKEISEQGYAKKFIKIAKKKATKEEIKEFLSKVA